MGWKKVELFSTLGSNLKWCERYERCSEKSHFFETYPAFKTPLRKTPHTPPTPQPRKTHRGLRKQKTKTVYKFGFGRRVVWEL